MNYSEAAVQGMRGFWFYAKEIKSYLGGFSCSGICSAAVKVLLDCGTGFQREKSVISVSSQS